MLNICQEFKTHKRTKIESVRLYYGLERPPFDDDDWNSYGKALPVGICYTTNLK
jgi:hypothetical protein